METTLSAQPRNIERITFTEEQTQLIRSQIAKDAKPDELALFLYQCKRTGLDPLARQMYCIHRGGKMTIQTSIDGFRVIAERSGDYAGQDAPEFMEGDNGPIACRITVYRFRGEQRYPAAVGVAYMSEYNAGGPMWNKMPHTMLAKCAEAQALRKAYPQDLSGLYTGDEMAQADTQEIDGHAFPIGATGTAPDISIPPAIQGRTPEQRDVADAANALMHITASEKLKQFIASQPEHVRKDAGFQEACKRKSVELKKSSVTV